MKMISSTSGEMVPGGAPITLSTTCRGKKGASCEAEVKRCGWHIFSKTRARQLTWHYAALLALLAMSVVGEVHPADPSIKYLVRRSAVILGIVVYIYQFQR